MNEPICIPLSILFSKSLDSGTLPEDWKSAHITPIHKKGAHNLVTNYWPISLTSTIIKLMESIINDNILNHITFCFLPGRSCTTQLLNILDHLTYHLDIGYSVHVIYLDFRKVFYSVPHQWLLHKLISFGIHSKLLKWIESFHTNRQQQVIINGHLSSGIYFGTPTIYYVCKRSTINCFQPYLHVCWWYQNFPCRQRCWWLLNTSKWLWVPLQVVNTLVTSIQHLQM